jgi:MFS family permease
LSFFAVPVAAAAMLSAGESWRAPYIWLAFAPVISGVMVWYLAPREHEPTRGGVDRWAVFRELGSVIRLVGPLVSVSIVFQMIYAALLAFTTLYLVDARGLEPTWAAAVFGVPQLVGVLGGPASGFLSDRLGRRTVILTGMGLLGPSLYLLTVVPAELLLLPLILIGVAATMRQTVTEVFVLDSAPPHRRATVLGSYYMLSQELGGLAAPLLGFLALTLGITAAYTGTCIALAAMSVAVVLAGRRL